VSRVQPQARSGPGNSNFDDFTNQDDSVGVQMDRTRHVTICLDFLRADRLCAAIATAAVVLATAGATNASSVANGQQDSAAWQNSIREATENAKRQLQSPDPKDVAWGASRAAEYRLDVLAPDIASAIGRAAPSEHLALEESAMLSALFDAAVQLDAAVPVALLVRFWERFPVQTSMLLAHATGERDATLLELAGTTKGLRWFVVANALLNAKAHGFGASLLKNLRFRVLLTVSEGGNTGTVDGGGAGGMVGDGIGVNPNGFPPEALYRFELLPAKGNIVLSTGPRTVYYSRTVENRAQFGVSSFDIGGPTDEERFQYVTAMAGSQWQRMSLSRSESVRWQDTPRLIEDVRIARIAAQDRYQALVEGMVSAGYLTVEEAASLSKPLIEIRLIDARKDKSIPLPDIR
jgi:hypothetical protein